MFYNSNIKEDIIIAQKILSCSYSNIFRDDSYHNKSFIYRFTNENISNYRKYLEDKNRILTVTSSGDQILNSILLGSKEIDSFDISRFPKYFYELKKAAILSLSKEEFLKFFVGEYNESEDYDEIYFGINGNLDKYSKKFWDSLFNFFDATDIYSSSLFSNETIISNVVEENNPYLFDDNYKMMKEFLKDIEVNHYVSDIGKLVSSLDGEYDLVNLSSIFYYGFGSMDNYSELLNLLPLSENGEALTYLYKVREELVDYFQNSNYKFHRFKNEEGAVLVYKR